MKLGTFTVTRADIADKTAKTRARHAKPENKFRIDGQYYTLAEVGKELGVSASTAGRDVLRTLPDASVHSIVTDPPYELTAARPGGRSEATRGKVMGGFMGMAWDGSGVAFDVAVWVECLRVLKPGGHLLSFGGSRTYHRMACAIEDAGFEIRDQIMWIYGSGFPKSKNLDGDWDGWGTALKPAHEPIVVARKPLIGTVAANVQEHGSGALNILGCRIQTDESLAGGAYAESGARAVSGSLNPSGMNRPGATVGKPFVQPIGRWPANVIHDGSNEVLDAFPDAPGQQGDLTGHSRGRKSLGIFGDMPAARDALARKDAGKAARFFYCAKASKEDREVGCEGLPTKVGGMVSNTSGQHLTRRDGGAPGERANHHPTVKPTELMRYLVRLITPPGGTVLDPFAGSGSTGRAASIEGFDALLIELNPEYAAIARKRVAGDAPLLTEVA